MPAHVDVGREAKRNKVRSNFGPLVITALLILAVVIAALSILVPAIRAATMPRFGWGGLLSCLNPLIFLVIWFKVPARRTLLAASFMTCVIGLLNAVTLCLSGTVSSVENEFHDRLHSSWFWAVLPFFVAGGYLCWSAFHFASELPASELPDTDGGEQTDVR